MCLRRLTCLLGTEVLQRVSRRVGVKQQDSKSEIAVRRNHLVFLEGKQKHEREKYSHIRERLSWNVYSPNGCCYSYFITAAIDANAFTARLWVRSPCSRKLIELLINRNEVSTKSFNTLRIKLFDWPGFINRLSARMEHPKCMFSDCFTLRCKIS